MRYIISTVGTSILTNLLNRSNSNEGTWFGLLRDSANLERNELEQETENVIDTLADRALDELLKNDVNTNRRISAELNGIYGIYGGNLPTNSEDQHYLICTDTAQGQITGELIKGFLESCRFNVEIVIPHRLSTKNTTDFTAGTKELIKWLENNVSWQQDSEGHDVIFNLVGGFKSLQGYMQTFGAFYADESVYIFEGSSELIRIPRLPIQIDTSIIETHILEFAMMAAGEMYPIEDLTGIPETLLEPIDDNGNAVAGLSAWGELIWNRAKSTFLSRNLLEFPRLTYLDHFTAAYDGLTANAKVKLQETLARVAYLLEVNAGSTVGLGSSGLRFKQLQGLQGVYTFRVARGIRVSCSEDNGTLNLHRYGKRNDINSKPI